MKQEKPNDVNVEQPELGRETEYVSRPARRKFSNEYKRRIVKEAEACTDRGEIGALLRREGLYSSHLTDWRRQASRTRRTGVGAQEQETGSEKHTSKCLPLEKRVDRTRTVRTVELRQQLEQAEYIISAQKKLSLALEQTLSGQKDAN